tara:strand:+ start:20090 stop:21451 length:1362 start_codon:yes stop_codon:yes gene_type:complete
MCKILKNSKEIREVISKINSNDFVISIPIFSDKYIHTLNHNNKLSLLFFKVLNGNSYIIPFNHIDSENVDVEYLELFDKIPCSILTINKKNLITVLKNCNVLDVNLMNYFLYNCPIDIENIRIDCIDFLYNKYYNMKNLNLVVPIYKHVEWCEKLSSIMIDIFNEFNTLSESVKNSYINYNNEVISSLFSIEKNGLMVTDNICDVFDNRVSKHISNNKIYSHYNIYTSTGRPSNSFGSINFAALNKNTGERAVFVSEFDNGLLVEYDYDAYHLRLIGKLIGYDFGNQRVHEHLSKAYGVSYDESKAITFKLLYGGIDDEVANNIEFFGKIRKFINNLWGEFKLKKELKTYIYSRPIIESNFGDFDRNKLFNYYIQSFETEYNIKRIMELQKLLANYESKLVLYGYDSFLFDINSTDGKNMIRYIKNILENDGFITKVKAGSNYNNIVNVSDKI